MHILNCDKSLYCVCFLISKCIYFSASYESSTDTFIRIKYESQIKDLQIERTIFRHIEMILYLNIFVLFPFEEGFFVWRRGDESEWAAKYQKQKERQKYNWKLIIDN